MVHLHTRSWFSFLAGGSSPEALVDAAVANHQSSLAITDMFGVYGAVRFAKACQRQGVHSVFGAIHLVDGYPLVFLAQNDQGYQNLCELTTLAHSRCRPTEGAQCEPQELTASAVWATTPNHYGSITSHPYDSTTSSPSSATTPQRHNSITTTHSDGITAPHDSNRTALVGQRTVASSASHAYARSLTPNRLTSTPHSCASTPHSCASTPYSCAATPHSCASTPHSCASTPHSCASTPHSCASTPHSCASTPHSCASTPHSCATTPHSCASTSYSCASAPRSYTSSSPLRSTSPSARRKNITHNSSGNARSGLSLLSSQASARFTAQTTCAYRPSTLSNAKANAYTRPISPNLIHLVPQCPPPSRPQPQLTLSDLAAFSAGIIVLSGGRESLLNTYLRDGHHADAQTWLQALKHIYANNIYVELCNNQLPNEHRQIKELITLARTLNVETVATNDVRYATPQDYALYDALTCIGLNITITTPHPQRPQNGQNYLCSDEEMLQRLNYAPALANSERIATMCQVNILAPYVSPPKARVPDGVIPSAHLRELCEEGLARLYPAPPHPLSLRARQQMEKELATVHDMELDEYFLVVREVVDYAKQQNIRCYGRGSAANSILAYLLGITAVCPLEHNLLFERFLHKGRRGMPDIDIDFDSERRLEVMNWTENRFGHNCCAMTAAIITYQLRGAMRDVLKILGCTAEQVNAICHTIGYWDTLEVLQEKRQNMEALLSNNTPSTGGSALSPAAHTSRATNAQQSDHSTSHAGPSLIELALRLVARMQDCPRHISLHNGGMVISRGPLSTCSPIQISANGLHQIQFDKDDIEALGLIKFDILGLRMLSVLSAAEEMIKREENPEFNIDKVPLDDPTTYKMICAGETMSIFQIESPGQVNLLARTQPTNFKDLVIQIALYRPGPLQGNMVTPYVNCRLNHQRLACLHPSLEPILADTLGIILFQEQILEICHQFAGMSLQQSDEFRRLVGKGRDTQAMRDLHRDFVQGAMQKQHIAATIPEQVFQQLKAFVGYGFCRSHAAAFARIVYHSAWLKRHHPAAYMAGVLRHHPGFYPLSTIREEIAHLGINMLACNIWVSTHQYEIERRCIRLPLTAVSGISTSAAQRIMELRQQYHTLESLIEASYRSTINNNDLGASSWEALAKAGAFQPEIATRREALWRVGLVVKRMQQATVAASSATLSLFPADVLSQHASPSQASTPTLIPSLANLPAQEQLGWDYHTQSYSTYSHPMQAQRSHLAAQGILSAAQVIKQPDNTRVSLAGIVVVRQKPPTANGMMFILLEDETARIQVSVKPEISARLDDKLRQRSLVVSGRISRHRGATNLNATTIEMETAQSLESFLGHGLFASPTAAS